MATSPAARRWQRATLIVTIVPFIFFAVIGAGRTSPNTELGIALFFGASMHVAATGWFVVNPDIRRLARRRPWRFLIIPTSLIVASVIAVGVLSPQWQSRLLLLFFSWQFFHFQKQNLGVVALAASSSSMIRLSTWERRWIVGSGCAGILGLWAHPFLLQLSLQREWRWLWWIGIAGVTACVIGGVWCLARRPHGEMRSYFGALYVSTLFFSAPVFLFHSPYAAVGGMTVAHGLQYLIIVGTFIASPVRGRRRWERMSAWSNILLFGATCLAVASHFHGASGFELRTYGLYLGVTMSHFVLDAGLWRMRDPEVRRIMSLNLPDLVPRSAESLRPTSPADIG